MLSLRCQMFALVLQRMCLHTAGLAVRAKWPRGFVAMFRLARRFGILARWAKYGDLDRARDEEQLEIDRMVHDRRLRISGLRSE